MFETIRQIIMVGAANEKSVQLSFEKGDRATVVPAVEKKRNSFTQDLWINWWDVANQPSVFFLKICSLCMDTQCNLTSHENMGSVLQRTPLCAMIFATGLPHWEQSVKALDVVFWDLLPCPLCSSDGQAAFIWERSENHLDEQGSSLAHEQTKPKHTVHCLSQFWASKWISIFWVWVDFCSFIVETKEELNKNMYTDNTQQRH